MSDKEFVDFYEVLEVSPNANSYTIERIFRFLAKRFHPDVAESSDVQRFSLIVEAYETLRDPIARAAYDLELNRQKKQTAELLDESNSAESDTAIRHRILTLFYAKRKRDMKNPGVGIATLEQAFEIPSDVMAFHLWYFREKGWIQREETGLLSITADGVDKIEDRILRHAESQLHKITDGVPRLPDQSQHSSAAAPASVTV
jgi:curved DNA-binding protein CbpA